MFMGDQNKKEKFAQFKKLPNLCIDKHHVVRTSGNIVESAQKIQTGITAILAKPCDTPKLSISDCQGHCIETWHLVACERRTCYSGSDDDRKLYVLRRVDLPLL